MKKITIASALLFTLLSCNRAGDALTTTEYITVSPRIARAQSVNDSIWNLAASVHIKLSSTNGISLFDDTILFSKRKSPSISAPSNQGVNVLVEGLSNANAIVWSGNTVLPPSTRDTAFSVSVSAVSSPNGSTTSLGTVNTPEFDSLSIKPWAGTDTFDQVLHAYISSGTPNAVIHYTLDGSYPSLQSPTYSAATGILIDSARQIKAIATLNGWTNSSVITRSFVLQMRPVIFDTNWSIGYAPFKVGLRSPSKNSVIRFTKNESIPSVLSNIYTDSLAFNTHDDSCVINAIAYNSSYPNVKPSIISSMRVGLLVPWNTAVKYDSIMDDRDGSIYRTIRIGSQTWFAENLHFKTPNSYCPETRNIDSICAMNGRAYSWAEAMGIDTSYNQKLASLSLPVQGICPSGWHVPSDLEWSILFKNDSLQNNAWYYQGYEPSSGQYLKYFAGVNIDSIGFRALRTIYDQIADPGQSGGSASGSFPIFWSATELSANSALSRTFYNQYMTRPSTNFKKDELYKYPKRYSLRCVK